MKLNKQRQQMYLDGKVGLINDNNDVEQLREVTNDREYMGRFTYYHQNRIFPSDAPLDNRTYHPIAWFYENEMELPKIGEWWECIKSYLNQYTKGKKYLCEIKGKLTDDDNAKYNGFSDIDVYNLYFIKCTQPTPTSYKLNIDIPEWVLKAGDEIESGRLPRSIMEYIATPCITFTLENGTQIELTQNDIDKIKKLQL